MNEEALKAVEKVKGVFNNDAKTLARLDAYLSDKTNERIIAFCSKETDKIKKELSQWESRMKKKNQPATTTSTTEAEATTKKQTFAEVIAMYASNTNKIVFNDFKDAYNIIENLEKIIEKVKEVQAKKKDAHIQKLKEEEERLRKEIEELSKS